MPQDIYLDYNATTPVLKEVREAISDAFLSSWGNPSSNHEIGKRAKIALDSARRDVARAVSASEDEIVFTSGGTESNNLAIIGLVRKKLERGRHVITTRIEHPSVLNPFIRLMEEGVEVTFVRPNSQGIVEPDAIKELIRPDTIFCSVMLANNETGAIQPIKEISSILREQGVTFHTDAAQAVGKIPVDVNDLGVDLLTICGHKLYAPKGIGALFIRKGVALENILYGAGQERGVRPGTEPVPLAVGLGRACSITSRDVENEGKRLRELKEFFLEGLRAIHPDMMIFSPEKCSLPNTLAVSFRGLLGSKVLKYANGLMASTGAACHDRSVTVSHVLSSMGVSERDALGMVRFSLGRFTTRKEIEEAIGILKEAITKAKGKG